MKTGVFEQILGQAYPARASAFDSNSLACFKEVVCRQFVQVCRRLDVFSDSSVAIDGSKFKAVKRGGRDYELCKASHNSESRPTLNMALGGITPK